MKNMKKLFALVLAVVMVFSLSISAFAATSVSTTQDSSVLTLASEGNTVSYMATTVDGGVKDGVTYNTTTTYSYAIKTSGASVTVTATLGNADYYLKLNNAIIGTTFSLNKNTRSTLAVCESDEFGDETVVRSFDVTVVDATSVNVTIEINCVNAKTFIDNNATATAAATAYNLLNSHMHFNDNGKMTSVVSLNLPAGSTAMDALYALQAKKNFTISGTGSATGTNGTVYTYISAIDGLGEKMCGSWSGWCYLTTQPGSTYTMPMVGAASYSLTEGEHITWIYTCTYSDFSGAMGSQN